MTERIDEKIKLYCGDCLEVMPTLETGSADLVFGSPPYENTRTYGIDFSLKGQEWVDWMVAVVKECLRICKGLVAFVVEGKTKGFRWSATPALLMADLHRQGICLRKPPAFYRVGIPGSGGTDFLRNDYELIVCCTSGGKLPWNDKTAMGHPPKWAPGGEMSYRLSDGTRRNQWGASEKSTGGDRGKDGELKAVKPRPSHRFTTKRELYEGGARRGKDDKRKLHGYTIPVKANPGNVIRCNVGGGAMGSPLAHENEAPFPETLAEFFIKSFCPPGGIVLDPFGGSGTTAAVALKQGRKAIAIDIRKSQCEIMERRIEEIKAKPYLFTNCEL